MDIIEGPVIVEPVKAPTAPSPQPIPQLASDSSADQIDEAKLREASIAAQNAGFDPTQITKEDMDKGWKPAVDVPQKFLKSDGTADVEKIQASTRQLDEGIAKKQEAIAQAQKSVDDYMKEYKQKETEFRNLPNPQKLPVPSQPAQPLPTDPSQMTTQQLEEVIRKDYQADPILTTTRLIDLAIQSRLAPIEQREREQSVRANVAKLAESDPRVLQESVFAAINEKLRSDPDLWRLKNPHKAAWLEVKEELRLGDLPQGGQAQPSKPVSPVLGGSVPPSVPSSVGNAPANVLGNLDKLDLRDRKQEAVGDEAVKAFLAQNRW